MSDTATEAPEVENAEDVETTEALEAPDDVEDTEQPDTFPRKVVEELRRESAKYRDRAKRADELAERLHRSLVERTGRLADPADLPFDAAHLDDQEALDGAIEALLAEKPHLASRRPRGDVGQGARPEKDGVSLGSLLRARV